MSTERVIGLYKARLLEATCRTNAPDWAWRKWYEGKTGQLYLIRSRTDPAKYHICFNLRHKRWLTTSRGTYEIRDMNLVFTTNHSVYTFEIQNEADRKDLMGFIRTDSATS